MKWTIKKLPSLKSKDYQNQTESDVKTRSH